MIKSEFYMTRSDGVELTRTYSDRGMKIERDGVRYAEAIDPAYLNRQYTETGEPIDGRSGTPDEAEMEDAYQRGVNRA